MQQQPRTVSGLVWPEMTKEGTPYLPKFLGDPALWETPPAGTQYTLRCFPPTELAFRLPIKLVAGISSSEMELYRIAPGDFVVRELRGLSAPIVSVNAVPLAEWQRRWPEGNQPAWGDLPTFPRQLLPFTPKSPLASLLATLFPFLLGTTIIIEGPRASRKTDVLNAILSSLDPRCLIMHIFLERGNEVMPGQPIEGTFIPTRPLGIEAWNFPFAYRDVPEEIVKWVDFAFLVAQRRALSGQNVILLLDSLEAFAKSLMIKAPTGEAFLSGGLSKTVLDMLAARYLAIAKHPVQNDLGSLTVFGLYRLNQGDRGTSTMATEVEGDVDALLTMRDRENTPDCPSFPVSLKPNESFVRRLENILSPEILRQYRVFLSGLFGRELRIYTEEVGDRRPPTPEHQQLCLQRATTRIEQFYQGLLQAVDGLPPEVIWAHGQAIIAGEYPRREDPKPGEAISPAEATPPEMVAEAPPPMMTFLQMDAAAKKLAAVLELPM